MKKEYLVNVKHVDNRLVIFLNGETIWDSGITHNDPEMDVFINITESLLSHSHHTSELIFEGFNDTYGLTDSADDLNPWHFHYRVIARTKDESGKIIQDVDLIKPYNEKHTSNPNIKAIDNCYQIVQRNNEFKVVSNSLAQNFCV